jgi:hypothetical protein
MTVADFSDVSLDDKYVRDDGRIYLTGVQALVRLPLVQRRRDRAAGLNTARPSISPTHHQRLSRRTGFQPTFPSVGRTPRSSRSGGCSISDCPQRLPSAAPTG